MKKRIQLNLLENKDIIKNYKNKSGVYQLINKITGKTYIGSAFDLARRLLEYLNPNRLIRELKRWESIIYKSLLKYGQLSFDLIILEYIDLSKIDDLEQKNLLLRSLEQKYIDQIKPEYNILQIAGSNRGHKLSSHTRIKMSEAKKGLPSHRKGTTHNLTSKNLMKLNSGRNKIVYVFNSEKVWMKTFRSITYCSMELNISSLRIRTAIKNNKLVDNTYYFSHFSNFHN